MLPVATVMPGGAEGHASRLGEHIMDGGAAIAIKPICLWCESGFDPRRGGGAPQRFCQPKCRDAFHSAGRRWAEMAVLSGIITVGDLRNVSVAPCTLAGRVEGASDYPGIGSDENALGMGTGAQRYWAGGSAGEAGRPHFRSSKAERARHDVSTAVAIEFAEHS